MSRANPARGYMEYLLDWRLIHPSSEQLREVSSRSRLGRDRSTRSPKHSAYNSLPLADGLELLSRPSPFQVVTTVDPRRATLEIPPPKVSFFSTYRPPEQPNRQHL